MTRKKHELISHEIEYDDGDNIETVKNAIKTMKNINMDVHLPPEISKKHGKMIKKEVIHLLKKELKKWK